LLTEQIHAVHVLKASEVWEILACNFVAALCTSGKKTARKLSMSKAFSIAKLGRLRNAYKQTRTLSNKAAACGCRKVTEA
jgi:hypothetical protein